MRILIIEDNPNVRELVKLGLEAESFIVDGAENGEDGSYLARTNEYDLVILDIGLPRRRGTEVLKEIRKAKRTMPILMLSVEREIPTKVGLLSIGADDYMTKPFSFEELLARVRALLRRPIPIVKERLSVGQIILDSTRQKATRGGKEIYLTRKEYLLLECLVRNRGSIVTKGKLIEHAWDIDSDPFSSTIETHMSNLRKKINPPKSSVQIKNIPSRGYTLEVFKKEALVKR